MFWVSVERRDKWGHPRIWATVTGWPPICQEVRDNFTQEEVVKIHTKRFLEFQDLKRQHSARLKRPIILHCCILAFEPSTVINLGNAKWVNAAMQYLGEVLPSKKGTKKAERESYTTDQWFFPMSLNTPAVRTPPPPPPSHTHTPQPPPPPSPSPPPVSCSAEVAAKAAGGRRS